MTPVPGSSLSDSAGEKGWTPEKSSSDSTTILEQGLSGSGQESLTPAFKQRRSGAQSLPIFHPNEVVAGRYRIARFVGRGGMGEVYAADDMELGERVALKALSSDVVADSKVIDRLKQEIHLARKVTHPNVCRTLEFGYHEAVDPEGVKTSTPYLTMEYLDGETLARRLERVGRLSTAQALPLVIQVAAALVAAHKSGVVHRDLKPGNIVLVLSDDGETRAVVTDFGLAGRTSGRESFVASGAVGKEVSGTWAYMAPEQILGEDPSPAADLYALGVVIFEMVTGTLPFEGDTPLATAFKRLNEPPPSPRERVPELSDKWESAILRCLERDPADRFRSAADLAHALSGGPAAPSRRVTTQLKTRSISRRLAASVAGVLLLAAISTLGYRFWSMKREARLTTSTQAVPPQVSTVAPSGPRSPGSSRPAGSAPRGAATEPKESRSTLGAGAGNPPAPRVRDEGAGQGARLLISQAQRLERQGDMTEAERKYEEALAIQREIQDRSGAAETLDLLADLKAGQHDFAGARSRLEEALALRIQIGDRRGASASLNESARLYYEQGDLPAARRLYEQALESARDTGSKGSVVEALIGLGAVTIQQGELDRARARLEEALSLANQHGDKLGMAETHLALARLYLADQKASESENFARSALKEFGDQGHGEERAFAEGVMASAFLDQGKRMESAEAADRALALAQKTQDTRLQLRMAIIAAQARAATGKETERDEIASRLLDLASAARKDSFLEGELLARLALGELEMTWGKAAAGRSRLVAVEKKAEANGFGLIAREAAKARKKKL